MYRRRLLVKVVANLCRRYACRESQLVSPNAQSARFECNAVIDSIPNAKIRPLGPEVGRLRAIKSTPEQEIMRHAADISGLAHAKVNSKIFTTDEPTYISLTRQCALLSPICLNTHWLHISSTFVLCTDHNDRHMFQLSHRGK